MKNYLTEFVGTFFLVLLTIGLTVLQGSQFAPLAIGASLMIMVYAGGHVSGGHYNPAVSLAAMLRGALPKSQYLPYVASQILGATVAAYVAYMVDGQDIRSDARCRSLGHARRADRVPLHVRAVLRGAEFRGVEEDDGQLILWTRDRFHDPRCRVRRRRHLRWRVQPCGRCWTHDRKRDFRWRVVGRALDLHRGSASWRGGRGHGLRTTRGASSGLKRLNFLK